MATSMSPRFFILFSCPVLLFNWYHLIKRVICWIRMNYFLDKFDTNCDTWLWVVDKRRNSTMASWQFPKIHLQWNFDEKLSVRHLLYFPGREWNCEKEKKTKQFLPHLISPSIKQKRQKNKCDKIRKVIILIKLIKNLVMVSLRDLHFLIFQIF